MRGRTLDRARRTRLGYLQGLTKVCHYYLSLMVGRPPLQPIHINLMFFYYLLILIIALLSGKGIIAVVEETY
ncbi:MAG: hypothetical protein H0Z35_00380 [Thermoanaerobacteraceae bacterium]|nr:hypothetical protein [Thermoanaerobacteraceae bacterium]